MSKGKYPTGINNLRRRDRYFSFEFFPPKSLAGTELLYNTISQLRELQPDFVSMTCRVGGQHHDKTKEWSDEIQKRYGLTVMPHYTSVGIQREAVHTYLTELETLGIKNIMVLRGDLPDSDSNPDVLSRDFLYASDLIGYIRHLGFDFSLGGACYPEVHPEASSFEEDLRNLKKKVKAGADFLITQLFFDNDNYFRFVERCRAVGIHIPIAPGIMPITNHKQFEKIVAMTSCHVPKKLLNEITKYREDVQALYQVGYEHSLQQCQELLAQQAPGIHFYTLNHSSVSKEILTALR